MNQLQKDIKTALSWKQWQPWEKTTHQDQLAFQRLECYIKKDIQIYCKMEIEKIIQEAINTERTQMGRNVLKQLLEAIQ